MGVASRSTSFSTVHQCILKWNVLPWPVRKLLDYTARLNIDYKNMKNKCILKENMAFIINTYMQAWVLFPCKIVECQDILSTANWRLAYISIFTCHIAMLYWSHDWYGQQNWYVSNDLSKWKLCHLCIYLIKHLDLEQYPSTQLRTELILHMHLTTYWLQIKVHCQIRMQMINRGFARRGTYLVRARCCPAPWFPFGEKQ